MLIYSNGIYGHLQSKVTQLQLRLNKSYVILPDRPQIMPIIKTIKTIEINYRSAIQNGTFII